MKQIKMQTMNHKYFNIIPSENRSCCILLYGNIGEWEDLNSADVTKELMQAEAMYDNIDVRINSTGGEVYTGIAIFNAFRNSKANIKIYVDGIAASMASVIALCGKPVFMSKYARLMIHSVSGGVYGNKVEIQKCLEEINALEDTLCEMYAAKTGKTAVEMKEAYFDGEDHWIKAEEAKNLGFIDGIYDAEPVPEDSTPEQIYAEFNNRLKKPQNKVDMNLEKLKKHERFSDCASEEDVLQAVDALEAEASDLREENATLRAENQGFKTAQTAREEAEKKALLDEAEKDGRIDANTRKVYKNLLDSDRANGEAALMALKPQRRAMVDINNQPEDQSPWEKRQAEISANYRNKSKR